MRLKIEKAKRIKIRKSRKVILGIDLGFRATGVAVYDPDLQVMKETRVLRCPAPSKQERKTRYVSDLDIVQLRHWGRMFDGLFKLYEIERCYVEFPTGGAQSQKATKAMSYIVAAFTVSAQNKDVAFSVVRPLELKMLVSGGVRREVQKPECIQWVVQRYGKEILPPQKTLQEHAADAILCVEHYKGIAE